MGKSETFGVGRSEFGAGRKGSGFGVQGTKTVWGCEERKEEKGRWKRPDKNRLERGKAGDLLRLRLTGG
jgi:hypothetical protein